MKKLNAHDGLVLSGSNSSSCSMQSVRCDDEEKAGKRRKAMVVVRHQCYAEVIGWHDVSSVTFVVRQFVERGEVRKRDNPAWIKPLREAWEVSALAHRCQEHLFLHLRCLADRPVLGAAGRSLELEPRKLHHLLDVCAPVKYVHLCKATSMSSVSSSRNSHLFLFVDQLTLAHFTLSERERQLDVPVSLGYLQVERGEQCDEV